MFELEGLSCGYDFGAPVCDEYEPPFAFTGTIHSVTFDLSGNLIADDDAEITRLMAQQ
jgi:arylsulfatase